MKPVFDISKVDKDEVQNHGYGIWIWIGTLDDIYFSIKEFAEKHNPNRKRRFCIHLTFIKWEINLEIPYKHIGWNFRGKDRNPKFEEI
jgi:hypothetical protein